MTRIVLLGRSSGIGLATAKRCADAGWDVIVASRDPERAGVPGEKAPLDITDAPAVRAWSLLPNAFVTGIVLPVDGGHRLAAP